MKIWNTTEDKEPAFYARDPYRGHIFRHTLLLYPRGLLTMTHKPDPVYRGSLPHCERHRSFHCTAAANATKHCPERPHYEWCRLFPCAATNVQSGALV